MAPTLSADARAGARHRPCQALGRQCPLLAQVKSSASQTVASVACVRWLQCGSDNSHGRLLQPVPLQSVDMLHARPFDGITRPHCADTRELGDGRRLAVDAERAAELVRTAALVSRESSCALHPVTGNSARSVRLISSFVEPAWPPSHSGRRGWLSSSRRLVGKATILS